MFKNKYAQYECLSGSLGFRLDVILSLLSAENTTFSHIFDTWRHSNIDTTGDYTAPFDKEKQFPNINIIQFPEICHSHCYGTVVNQ